MLAEVPLIWTDMYEGEQQHDEWWFFVLPYKKTNKHDPNSAARTPPLKIIYRTSVCFGAWIDYSVSDFMFDWWCYEFRLWLKEERKTAQSMLSSRQRKFFHSQYFVLFIIKKNHCTNYKVFSKQQHVSSWKDWITTSFNFPVFHVPLFFCRSLKLSWSVLEIFSETLTDEYVKLWMYLCRVISCPDIFSAHRTCCGLISCCLDREIGSFGADWGSATEGHGNCLNVKSGSQCVHVFVLQTGLL